MTVKAKPPPSNTPSLHRPPSTSAAQMEALAESQLRAASVRITTARVKVLAALLSAPRAYSHQDVQDTLADMDRVTLYRALECLREAGLAHKIAGDDRVFRYSAGAEHGNLAAHLHDMQHQHGHFKCTRCAKVFCLDNFGATDPVESVLQNVLGQGFQSHDIEFIIKGWCAECAQ